VTGLRDRVLSVAAAVLDVRPHDLTEDATADTIASWDSLRHVLLVVALEEEFGIHFSAEQMDGLQTIGGCVRAVQAATARA
jgi:acyl carrier protein